MRGDSIGSLDSLPALEEEEKVPTQAQTHSSNARGGAALT
jgi:hypothetical protein